MFFSCESGKMLIYSPPPLYKLCFLSIILLEYVFILVVTRQYSQIRGCGPLKCSFRSCLSRQFFCITVCSICLYPSFSFLFHGYVVVFLCWMPFRAGGGVPQPPGWGLLGTGHSRWAVGEQAKIHLLGTITPNPGRGRTGPWCKKVGDCCFRVSVGYFLSSAFFFFKQFWRNSLIN